jgi:hypothetical protein
MAIGQVKADEKSNETTFGYKAKAYLRSFTIVNSSLLSS